ncbi:MAG: phage portal protein [Candidatus Atribacteria bacterium]|nr:phage portal protein [Candidatus Atribacteria bacterium]
MPICDLFAKRSLENPSVPLSDPDDTAYDWLGGERTATGKRITAENVTTLSAVFRGVAIISNDVGTLPCHVYKRTDRGKERAPEHPAFRLVRRKANETMLAFEFRRSIMVSALLNGNGYAQIVRSKGGVPQELRLLSAMNTYPFRVHIEGTASAQWYHHTGEQGGVTILRPDEVLHIKGFSFDGLIGYGIAQKARESLGQTMALEEYGSRFFANNARPNVILEHPGILTEPAAKNLRDSWNRLHAGLENAHKVGILEEGMKAHEMTINARDSQLLESRRFQTVEISNWIGVPPHFLGDSSRAAYNSLEMENQSYLDRGLNPWLVQWEEEYGDKLLTESEKKADSHYVAFTRAALLQANLATRATYYRQALGGAPWMTINEVRTKEDMNESDMGDADELLLPLNMGTQPEPEPAEAPTPEEPATGDGTGTGTGGGEEPEDEKPSRAAVERVVDEAGARMLRRIGQQVRRAAKKPKEFLEAVEGLTGANESVMRAALDPALRLMGCDDAGVEAAGRGIVEAVASAAIAQYDTVTPERFEGAIDEAMATVEARSLVALVREMDNGTAR